MLARTLADSSRQIVAARSNELAACTEDGSTALPVLLSSSGTVLVDGAAEVSLLRAEEFVDKDEERPLLARAAGPRVIAVEEEGTKAGIWGRLE
jgi:hypothetical protein